MYRVSEFAEKAGVTVRTLHHYDRMGLLKPSGRTNAGYRLYGERDLVRLQQIVTLKFISAQDAVNLLGFDEVIVSMLPARWSRWLHLDLPRKVRGLGLPVTEVIVAERDLMHASAA